MSEADSPAAGRDDTAKDREVNYRFCQDCANLLYPKENRGSKELFYMCKACHRIEQHNVACTYRDELHKTAAETAGVTTDVAHDPTLPHTKDKTCPKCTENDCVYFQSQQRAKDSGMRLYFVCCICGHVFL